MAKIFNRTYLPDSIKYNKKVYKVNIEYSSKYSSGKLFPVCNPIVTGKQIGRAHV